MPILGSQVTDIVVAVLYFTDGSDMAILGSQVNDIVIACLTPSFNFSTKCTFSDPDVKKDTRPEIQFKRSQLLYLL